MSDQNKPREKTLQNSGWSFMYGDIREAMAAEFDDSEWFHIGLPHSFGIPYFMENNFYVGYGCYRKTIRIRKEWAGKRISLEFQGVFQEAEIYMNGILAGTHKGGYTAFIIDISDLVREGKNQLFVKVNNFWNPRLAPRAGEHTFNGGIYRDVSLLVTDPVHVSWYGTFVRTSEVSENFARLIISTEVENHTGNLVQCTLHKTLEFEGQVVCEFEKEQLLFPGQVTEINQEQSISFPRLWHPDTPDLYLLKSRLYIRGQLVDEYETVFGIRWFIFTAQEGFFLNGKHYKIWGANVHQDHAGWCDAVSHAGIYRDVKMIKDCGMNFIRGSHYPHHTVFADECDRQGILFWSELCFWGIGGCKDDGYWNSSAYPVNPEDEAEFEESCITTLREMIRTNRNHPSIIVWSMCNEVFFSKREVLEKARNLIKRLVHTAHACDSTRPAASGGAQRGGFDLLGDLAGYNGDGASLFIDPGFPSFVSEYGSRISKRPGEYSPYFTDGVEIDYKWRSGKALWCGFHHGSIADQMGYMGFIDYYRLPLRSYYWYRRQLLGIEPPKKTEEGTPHSLVLSADRLTVKTDGTDDVQLIVAVVDKAGNRINNSMNVTLEIMEGGALFPTGRTIQLSQEKENLIEGLGAIEVRAFYAGEIKITARAQGVICGELTLTAIGEEKWRGQSLSLQTAPPSVYILEQDQIEINIARDKPVFCSSFDKNSPPQHINDDEESTFWRAATNGLQEWIQLDLEGVKKINKIAVRFQGTGSTAKIQASADGRIYENLTVVFISYDSREIHLEKIEKSYRYIKVYFPDYPLDITEIQVF